MNTNNDAAISELINLLVKGNAHVTFEKSIENISFEKIGVKPANLPYSIWMMVEHMRITQQDILDFSTNPDYKPLKWPEEYWPKEDAPLNEKQWEKCLEQIKEDRDHFINLITKPGAELHAPFAHGDGQTLFRETLLIADHTSYHTGQIVLIRRLLNDWN